MMLKWNKYYVLGWYIYIQKLSENQKCGNYPHWICHSSGKGCFFCFFSTFVLFLFSERKITVKIYQKYIICQHLPDKTDIRNMIRLSKRDIFYCQFLIFWFFHKDVDYSRKEHKTCSFLVRGAVSKHESLRRHNWMYFAHRP